MMKLQSLLISLTFICTGVLLADTITIKSASAQTASQIKFLRSQGLPVVLPTYVPSGFRRVAFSLQEGRGKTYSYDTKYTGPNNCEFQAGGATGGWGATPPVRQWVVNTSLFGQMLLEEHSRYGGGPNYLLSTLIPEDGRGPLASKGFPKAGYSFGFSCTNSVFRSQEAEKILKSLKIRN